MRIVLLVISILALFVGLAVSAEPSKDFKDPLTGMEFVFVKGGCFKMGDFMNKGRSNESPVHSVCIDDYFIGKYEVTQSEWKKIMAKNPSVHKTCDNCPVDSVSRNDAEEYSQMLKQKTSKNYRLPTEAEWEFAARSGGKGELWAGTSIESELEDFAWYGKNSGKTSQPVGQKKPNGVGLYDMSGNVWEWVSDWYGSSYYSKSPVNNPPGPTSGNNTIRGGGYSDNAKSIRTTIREEHRHGDREKIYGFRLALSAQ